MADYKIDVQKSVTLLYTNNKLFERKIRKVIPYIISISNNKVLRNKLD